jgi:hypothetical protein
MQRFVAQQNIQHFKEMLAAESDPARRAMLAGMISEEEAKLTAAAEVLQVQQQGDGGSSGEVDRAQQQADLSISPKR